MSLQLCSFYPSEAKDVANFFSEPYTHSLGAGLKICCLQITCSGSGRPFAEHRHKRAGEHTEEKIYFISHKHLKNYGQFQAYDFTVV